MELILYCKRPLHYSPIALVTYHPFIQAFRYRIGLPMSRGVSLRGNSKGVNSSPSNSGCSSACRNRTAMLYKATKEPRRFHDIKTNIQPTKQVRNSTNNNVSNSAKKYGECSFRCNHSSNMDVYWGHVKLLMKANFSYHISW